MISEKIFANEFSGFWAECLPFLTPHVIAEFNLSGLAMGEGRREWMKPLASSKDNSNNDVIAETAFGLFVESLNQKKTVIILSKDEKLMWEIQESAKARVHGLIRGILKSNRTNVNKREAVDLAVRLETYFEAYDPDAISIQPHFKGCGILDSCFGDILARKILFELKIVDRNLRSADIRQLLIYCALNHRSSQYDIDTVGILNPRRGIEFLFDVEGLAERAAGKTPAELFHQISSFVADFETIHQPS